MEYERIHNVKMGVLSPTKLRMKLIGAQSSRRKEVESNSSRTSPSKIEEMKYAKNGLLAGDLDQEGGASKIGSYPLQQSNYLGVVHPGKPLEADYNGYDSGNDNGSTSSFEFHQVQQSKAGSYHRHIPSKWNEAEKWILNRRSQRPNNVLKRSNSQNHGNRQMLPSWLRISPVNVGQKHYVSRSVDTKLMVEKLPSVSNYTRSNSLSANGPGRSSDVLVASGDSNSLQRGNYRNESSTIKNPVSEPTDFPAVQLVSMRDIGTEMTPIPSEEPSRTTTPPGAMTPSHSSISSRPSSPRKGMPVQQSFPKLSTNDELNFRKGGGKNELSERELQIKTRREIAALGIQLGKMNIASWASKEELQHPSPAPVTIDADQLARMEYETRAAAWEDAEKSKHIARFKSEELKIKAWQSHQKAKFDVQMKKAEIDAERMRTRVKEKTGEKLAIVQRRAEEKQAMAEARMNRKAVRTTRQAEYIRQTGRIPSSSILNCSCLF
ncbi:remorin 4.1-like [Dioscorea cayenensis subsp. rotundata]|uniref:Remorin 4.1-like n=1 Tax=Dioscorea cayennensis subsp. rotundata TaxID=55577 RepID=A0AB40BJ34_DIOCR|nr:remorin 4.1-like [Dioscorea cayenensis subsp. rotundata]